MKRKSKHGIIRLCAITAALLLGGACTKIETPNHTSASQKTETAVMAAAPVETANTTAQMQTTAAPVTTTTTSTTTVTTVTTTVTTTAATVVTAPAFVNQSGSIDPAKPMVALTFDDGPGGQTNGILDTLECYGAHATFFVVGQSINEETGAVMQRAVGLGCEIGSHSFDHANLTKLSPEQLQQTVQQTDDRIFNAIGQYPHFLRPPYGAFDANVQQQVNKPLAFWSVDTKDWKTRNTASTVSAALGSIEDGDVVLMHDIYPETAAAAAQIVPSLIQQGYQLVTLSELTYYRGLEPENGTVVFSMHPDSPNYQPAPAPAEITTPTAETTTACAESQCS